MKASLTSCLVVLLAGCASVSVEKLPDAKSYRDGVRFYRPAPYLAVTKERKDGVESFKSQILLLPDTSEEYVITWRAGMSRRTSS